MTNATFKFSSGQLVHHRRYGYRGVVISGDATCQADLSWYHKNQTQPDRGQPWYHVLVDGASHTTYVAEENLEPDQLGTKVTHPQLRRFFKTFLGGRYHREFLN